MPGRLWVRDSKNISELTGLGAVVWRFNKWR